MIEKTITFLWYKMH